MIRLLVSNCYGFWVVFGARCSRAEVAIALIPEVLAAFVSLE